MPVFAGEGALKFPMREGSSASADKHNEEGISHFNQGNYDVALKHFQMASSIDPTVGESQPENMPTEILRFLIPGFSMITLL